MKNFDFEIFAFFVNHVLESSCRNMLSLIEACHLLTRAQVVAEAISRAPYLLPRPLPISHTHKSILAPRGERMQDFNTSHNASEKLYYAILSPLSITPILPNLKMSTEKFYSRPIHHHKYHYSCQKKHKKTSIQTVTNTTTSINLPKIPDL